MDAMSHRVLVFFSLAVPFFCQKKVIPPQVKQRKEDQANS